MHLLTNKLHHFANVSIPEDNENDLRQKEDERRKTGESSVMKKAIEKIRANPRVLRSLDPFNATACISPDPIPKKHR